MRRTKVFGLNVFFGGKLQRCVVAAKSQKEAARLFDVSLHYLRGYGSETGNAGELEAALNEPGKVIPRGKE